jgi:hypothetical protein
LGKLSVQRICSSATSSTSAFINKHKNQKPPSKAYWLDTDRDWIRGVHWDVLKNSIRSILDKLLHHHFGGITPVTRGCFPENLEVSPEKRMRWTRLN